MRINRRVLNIIVSVLLTCTLVFSGLIFCGCSNQGSSSSDDNTSSEEYDDEEEEAEDEEDEFDSEVQSEYPVVSYDEVGDYIDQTVNLYIEDYWWSYRDDIEGSPLFINVGADYPDPDRVQVIIWGEDLPKFDKCAQEMGFENFEGMLEAGLNGGYFTGTLEVYNDVAQMTLTDIDQMPPDPL
ncbi:hypothetical protein [Eubacterium sp. AB3007]|uniref:hypothetical protein n=1 Tax=Eubacterium sp. AB3007 TaxID=1392487 RepID=UPI000484F742|nr:hypothetical protein [Eubacterium sp. AB3007]